MTCFVKDTRVFDRRVTSPGGGQFRIEKRLRTGMAAVSPVHTMDQRFNNESWTDFTECVTMEGSSSFSTDEYHVINASAMINTSTSPRDVIFGNLYLHPHWLRYIDVIESAPGWFLNFVGVYMTVICIVGIIGNLTVITVFLRTKSLRTPSNCFIINVAISDALFSAVNGFPLMSIASFQRKWTWGPIACEWYAFAGAIFGFNSISTLSLIAIDRYLFISRPLEMLYKATTKRALVLIALSWAWSALWSLPPIFGWGRYIAEGFHVSCSFDYLTRTYANIAYNYCIFVFGFVLPVAVIAACYVGIIRSVSRQATEVMHAIEAHSDQFSSESLREKQEKDRHDQEIRLSKIAAIMVSLFVASWSPYALVAQFGIMGLDDLVTPYSAELPVMLAKASAIWNPLVYALTHPRYRAALRDMIPCCSKLFTSFDRERNLSRSESQTHSIRRHHQHQQLHQDYQHHQHQQLQPAVSTTVTTPNVEMVPFEKELE